MKPKIHPEFNTISVTCACGNSFQSASTAKELKVEVCSRCHPFYTGTQRLLDTGGRVERFKAKVEKSQAVAAEIAAKKAAKQPRVAKAIETEEKIPPAKEE